LNDIGWKDPSLRTNTAKGKALTRVTLASGIYTPQMVVDGHIELVGSDERGVQAVESATNAAKAQLSLSAIRFDGAQ